MKHFAAPRWKFIGGQLCLDFVNTAGGRVDQKVKNSIVFGILKEKLGTYEDLADWAKEAGLLDEATVKRLVLTASQKGKESKQMFDRAITLRESLFRVFKHVVEGWEPPEADIETINRECAIARNRQRLVYSSKKFAWSMETGGDDLDRVIWPVALSGAELLLSEELYRVRQCPGPDCGWLFLDTSKNQSRQWCDMKDCGNLAKVRRYRERQK